MCSRWTFLGSECHSWQNFCPNDRDTQMKACTDRGRLVLAVRGPSSLYVSNKKCPIKFWELCPETDQKLRCCVDFNRWGVDFNLSWTSLTLYFELPTISKWSSKATPHSTHYYILVWRLSVQWITVVPKVVVQTLPSKTCTISPSTIFIP